MKRIEATIRPEKLEPVRSVLADMGILGMTVTQVSGHGKQRGIALQSRAGEYRVEFLPKIKIEVVVVEEDLSRVLNAIVSKARTGEMGDGKIFVVPIEEAVRIRTGDTGASAI